MLPSYDYLFHSSMSFKMHYAVSGLLNHYTSSKHFLFDISLKPCWIRNFSVVNCLPWNQLDSWGHTFLAPQEDLYGIFVNTHKKHDCIACCAKISFNLKVLGRKRALYVGFITLSLMTLLTMNDVLLWTLLSRTHFDFAFKWCLHVLLNCITGALTLIW